MASKMIGIEIGSDTLKMVLCVGGVVKKAAVASMPEHLVLDGKVSAPAAMSEFITKVRKENGIPGGPCALVLPRQAVIATRVTMPVMNEKELLLNLPFEFRDFVGKDGNQYHYDYCVCGIHDNVMELYAAAVRKDVVEEYYTIFKKAGLTLKTAMPAEMAWANLIRNAENVPEKVCIVDVGHLSTHVNIFSGDTFLMGKDIEMAGAMLDETIAAEQQVDPYVAHTRKEANMNRVHSADYMQDVYRDLTMEIMKILHFFSYSDESAGGQLQHIYYAGGSSVIEPLRTALLKNTGMTLHHAFRLVPMGDVASDTALYVALAAGAALQK